MPPCKSTPSSSQAASPAVWLPDRRGFKFAPAPPTGRRLRFTREIEIV